MTDPVQLLRGANPVRDCDAPDFDRLLERLQHEPSEPAADLAPVVPGRFVLLRGVPRGTGRRALVAMVPVMIAVAVAAIALLSLRGSSPTTPSTGSIAYPPGQARGRVMTGSMHRFTVAASGARGQTWGAEWFRTTAGQICTQAGRQIDGQIGYVDIDGVFPHDGRFHPWAPDTAVDARCIQQPARGGITLSVAERVANSGHQLSAHGGCTVTAQSRCPAKDATTLYFGVLGSGAMMLNYGTEGHSEQSLSAGGPGADGEYIEAFQGAGNDICSVHAHCVNPDDPYQLVHPGSRAFVLYTGTGRICLLRGPGTDGVMAGRCRYGLTP